MPLWFVDLERLRTLGQVETEIINKKGFFILPSADQRSFVKNSMSVFYII